jgi:hypothetical protein
MDTLNKIFLGFKQVTSDKFSEVTDKKGYLWLVREVVDGELTGKADIWFGSRHYASFDPSIASEISKMKETIDALLKEVNAKVDSETYEAAINKIEASVSAVTSTATESKEWIDTFKESYDPITEKDRELLNSVENGAQVNKIEKIQLFGNELSINDKTVNIDFQADDIKLGTPIGDVFPANKTVHETLKSIYETFKGGSGNSGILSVTSSDDSIIVEGDENIKGVRVQVSSASDNKIVLRTVENEKGLYVEPLYYDGDDFEVE